MWESTGHVHTHVIGHGGRDNVKDVGGFEGVQLGLQDWVHGQDVDQSNVREVTGAGLCLVEGEALCVKSPVVLLTLKKKGNLQH